MSYVYKSIFAPEICQYLKLLSQAGRYISKIQCSLRSLDRFLQDQDLEKKVLESEVISAWEKTRNVSMRTKNKDINNINGFVKYLVSLGIQASCPEAPKAKSEYVPYIFSDTEFERMLSVADNFEAGKTVTRSALIFPILLRVLYGCGLRLSEGQFLRWKDVNLESGVLTINGKNLKQRFVPMDDSLTELLKSYRTMTHSDGICEDYLFESNVNPDNPFVNCAFGVWFRKMLKAAGICYAKQTAHERGPCPHCLRHCFTLESFLKSESEGRRFEDTAPFLAAYLGHEGPCETEAYLRSHHSMYTQSHQRVDAAIGYLFPEVNFDED